MSPFETPKDSKGKGYSIPHYILGIVMLMLFGGAVAFYGIHSYFVGVVHSEESYTPSEQRKVAKLVQDLDSIQEVLHTIDKKLDRVEYTQQRLLNISK